MNTKFDILTDHWSQAMNNNSSTLSPTGHGCRGRGYAL